MLHLATHPPWRAVCLGWSTWIHGRAIAHGPEARWHPNAAGGMAGAGGGKTAPRNTGGLMTCGPVLPPSGRAPVPLLAAFAACVSSCLWSQLLHCCSLPHAKRTRIAGMRWAPVLFEPAFAFLTNFMSPALVNCGSLWGWLHPQR